MTKRTLQRLALAGATAALIVAASAVSTMAQPPAAAPVAASPAVTAFAQAGPNKTVHNAEGPDCTIYRPETLSAKTPIVVWSNGRGQKPENYGSMLDRLASYGFVVAAANSGNAGAGVEPLACLDYLTTQNGTAGSPYNGKLDLTKVGAAGHSMGGGGTIMAGKDARVKTTAALLPYTKPGLGFVAGAQTQQNGPMLLLSGGADTVAPPADHQKPVFDQANVPVFWATLAGAVHMVPTTPDSGEYAPVVIAWFRYQLQGDARAKTLFDGANCGLCSAGEWTIQRKGGA